MATKKEELEAANHGLGCLGKAGPDEPVFILRAQDLLAPDVIEFWAREVEAKADGRSLKVAEARRCAQSMRDWQSKHYAHIPD